jgi:hypothetical protein
MSSDIQYATGRLKLRKRQNLCGPYILDMAFETDDVAKASGTRLWHLQPLTVINILALIGPSANTLNTSRRVKRKLADIHNSNAACRR